MLKIACHVCYYFLKILCNALFRGKECNIFSSGYVCALFDGPLLLAVLVVCIL